MVKEVQFEVSDALQVDMKLASFNDGGEKRQQLNSSKTQPNSAGYENEAYDVHLTEADVNDKRTATGDDDVDDANEIIGVLETPPIGTSILLAFQVLFVNSISLHSNATVQLYFLVHVLEFNHGFPKWCNLPRAVRPERLKQTSYIV